MFDRTVVTDRALFGETNGTYVAVLAISPIVSNPEDSSEFFQNGRETCWVCELGSASDDESFDDFTARIHAATLRYERRTLTHQSGGRHELRYQGGYQVDGEELELEYPRFDTPYAQAPRAARVIDVEFGGHHLHLDFEKVERRFE